jgi:hypothetical protein
VPEWYGNCPKCQPEHRALYFKSGPNKAGKYTFVCYHCGANTTREALPAQFESEYVDRLIRNGDAMYEMLRVEIPERFQHFEPMSGWRMLRSLRPDASLEAPKDMERAG